MSQERDIQSPDGQTRIFNKDTIANLTDEQLEAEVATILDRGHVNVRLAVNLPENLHGEWVPKDAASIAEMEAKGFEIDKKYAAGNALHSDGDGKPIVGDVVYMTCPKRLYQAVERVRARKFEEQHGTKKKEKVTQEEKGYANEDHGPIKPINESSKDLVGPGEIVTAVQAVKNAEALAKQGA